MIPRFDEPRIAGVRYTNRPGAYGIILRGRQVLLTLQCKPRLELQLPGGGIDPGETPVRALHREVFEETGWGIQIIRRMGAFQRYTHMPEYDLWARKVCHIYICTPTRVMGEIPEPGHTAHWMDIAKAVEVLGNSGDRQFLGRLLQNFKQNRR